MKKLLGAAMALAAFVAPAAASAAKFVYSVSFDVVQFGAKNGDSYYANGTFDADSLGGSVGGVTFYAITGASGTLSSNFNANLGTVTGVADNLGAPGFALFGDGSVAGADFALVTDWPSYFVAVLPFFGNSARYGEVGGPTTSLSITLAAVPEPATWAMMILGFGAIAVAMRRRRPAIA